MIAGTWSPSGLELSIDGDGRRALADALDGAIGSFCSLALGTAGSPRLTGIRIKVRGGTAAVNITRIGDVVHINGSSVKMAEIAALLRAATGSLRLADHAAIDPASDPMVIT